VCFSPKQKLPGAIKTVIGSPRFQRLSPKSGWSTLSTHHTSSHQRLSLTPTQPSIPFSLPTNQTRKNTQRVHSRPENGTRAGERPTNKDKARMGEQFTMLDIGDEQAVRIASPSCRASLHLRRVLSHTRPPTNTPAYIQVRPASHHTRLIDTNDRRRNRQRSRVSAATSHAPRS
jgi:hypothetical protein